MNMCVWLLLVWCVAAAASCVCIVHSVVQVQAWLCSAFAVNRCICIFNLLGLDVCVLVPQQAWHCSWTVNFLCTCTFVMLGVVCWTVLPLCTAQTHLWLMRMQDVQLSRLTSVMLLSAVAPDRRTAVWRLCMHISVGRACSCTRLHW